MRCGCRLISVAFVMFGLALLPIVASGAPNGKKGGKRARGEDYSTSDPKLPDAVRTAFDDKFPNAKILKADTETISSVTVYDIEFREGMTHKRADITADGALLKYTVFVNKKTVPKLVMKRLDAAVKDNDATLGRLGRIEITNEVKDGKVEKLDNLETRYSAEMTKGGDTARIVVDDKGKTVEEPKWNAKWKAKKDKAAA